MKDEITASMTPRLRVSILFFGAARDIVGAPQLEFQIAANSTVGTLKGEILAEYPELARFGRSLLIAVNCEYADENMTLKSGDEIAFFPPVSGGS